MHTSLLREHGQPPRINPNVMANLLDDMVNESRMQPEHIIIDGKPALRTHCDLAVGVVADWYGLDAFLPDAVMANDIIVMMMDDAKRWVRCTSWDVASANAQRGHLVVAGQRADGHGHVCVLAPEPMIFSGSWKKEVPAVANVGKTCWYGLALSRAFYVEPEAWIFLG